MLHNLATRAAAAGAPISAATLRQYRATANKLAAAPDAAPTAELTPAHIQRWQSWLYSQPIKIVTANSYGRTARAMFNRINRPDLAAAIRLRPEPPPPAKTVSEENFAALLAVASVRDTAVLLLLAESGCRRGAIPRLKLSDLKIWVGEGGGRGDQGRFRVACRTLQKGQNGGKEIIVFAGHKTGLALKLWLEIRPYAESDHIFVNLRTGQPLQANAVTQITARLKMKAGIPADQHVNPHAFRHRFAQTKLREGYDLKVISQWLGHESAQTTADIYGRRTLEDLASIFFREKAPPIEFS